MTVRRAVDGGFHPDTTDESGRTLHQIAKTLGQTQIELLMRSHQEHDGLIAQDARNAFMAITSAGVPPKR